MYQIVLRSRLVIRRKSPKTAHAASFQAKISHRLPKIAETPRSHMVISQPTLGLTQSLPLRWRADL
jgi:hypothetical protein